MLLKRLSIPVLAASVLAGASGAVLAQAGMGTMPENPPATPRAAPSVDTGAAGTDKAPVRETSDPNATGSLVGSPAANPPGNPSGTIQPNANDATNMGASGINPCFPGQSGQAVGNTNPSGTASRC